MRKFRVDDRVTLVAPGTNDGECAKRWLGATGRIETVEDNGVYDYLPYFVIFDEVTMDGGRVKANFGWWCAEEELDFEFDVVNQLPEVDDLL